MEGGIHIYHTNDIHSHFENWPRNFLFYLQAEKKQIRFKWIVVFLFEYWEDAMWSSPS